MEECICCKIAQGREDGYREKKHVIELEGGWVLNHFYHDKEKVYLGWLVLGTKCHRPDWGNLSYEEIKYLGINIQRINYSLRQYWSQKYPDDSVELIHIGYLNESPYINGLNGVELLNQLHVHLHLLTRTREIGEAVGYCGDKIGWHLIDHICKFPDKYKVSGKDDKKVIELMNKLKYLLGRRTAKNE